MRMHIVLTGDRRPRAADEWRSSDIADIRRCPVERLCSPRLRWVSDIGQGGCKKAMNSDFSQRPLRCCPSAPGGRCPMTVWENPYLVTAQRLSSGNSSDMSAWPVRPMADKQVIPGQRG